MISKLENLLERMKRAKRTTVFALLGCDKDEEMNIIWIDERTGYWIETLEEIISMSRIETKKRNP